MFKGLIASYRHSSAPRRAARGQSFVEFALVMPILLIIVAGVLEVGNTLTIYNRVQLAAREGARFAAAGGADVRSIIDQASRESLEMDEDFLTVWVIRPTINAGPGVWEWENGGTMNWGVEEKCIFGDLCVLNEPSPVRPERVLDEVAKAQTQRDRTEIDGTTFAVVVVYYEVDTILNLPFWRAEGTTGQGRIPVTAFGIMAQEVEDQTVEMLGSGCSAYPLAVSRDVFCPGIPSGEPCNPVGKPPFKAWLNIDDNNNFRVNGLGLLSWSGASWEVHYGGLTAAPASNHPGAITSSAVSLHPDWGYREYFDPDDTSLHRGDWVLNIPAMNPPISVIQEDLTIYEGDGRQMRVLVYETEQGIDANGYPIWVNPVNLDSDSPNAEKWLYQVSDFAIVRITDVKSTGSTPDNYVEFEFIRWDRSCGFDPDA